MTGANTMENIHQFLKTYKQNQGEPREGFQEYFQKCKQLTTIPTAVPELCKYYEIPEKYILHEVMVQPFYDSRTMVARPTDVLVVSYPKTGTTWTQEISYLVVHGADFVKARSAPTEVRFPFMEIPFCGIKGIEKVEDPRLIKSHLPYDLLPQSFIDNKTKIIYIVRNPRDTLVSFFHFCQMVGYVGYDGTFEQFVESFCEEKFMYSSFARNVLSFWNRKNDENILFLFYEDLQKDLKANVLKIATFLNKSLSEDQIDGIVEHATFDNMKKNPMANYSHGGCCIKTPGSKVDFLRKGKSGDWKNYFTPQLIAKVDAYVEKHFKGTGIEFDYEV